MILTQEGIDLIKQFEGWRSNAYQDSVGVWTIGYGHTSNAGPPKVHSGLKITLSEGETILRRDLKTFENAVARNVTVPLNPNQYSALVSFCYNVGPGNFARSTLRRRLNTGDYLGASKEFLKWNKAGGTVLAGLVRRREAEQALFLKPTYSAGTSSVNPIVKFFKWLFGL